MAKVIDELITRYTLDDRFSGKAKKIQEESRKTGQTMNTGSAIGKVFSGVLSDLAEHLNTAGKGALGFATSLAQIPVVGPIITIALGAIILALGGVSAGFLGVVKVASMVVPVVGQATSAMHSFFESIIVPAIEAASKVDMIKRRLLGVYEDITKANQALAFSDQFAEIGSADKSTYAEATASLAQTGLDPSWLKIVELVASGRGGGKENVDRVVDLLQRLAAGDYGEALGPEGFGRYLPGLKERNSGLFNKQGSFTGTKLEAFNMIAKEAQKNLGIFELVADSLDAKIGNFQSSFQSFMESIGSVASEIVMPIMQGLGEWLTWFAESGIIKEVVNGFKEMLSPFTANAPSISQVMTTLVITMKELPSLFEPVKNVIQTMWELLQNIGTVMVNIGGTIAKMTGGLQVALYLLYKLHGGDDSKLGAFIKSLKELGKSLESVFNKATDPNQQSIIQKQFDSWKKDREKNTDAPALPETKDLFKQTTLQEKIEENTKKTAELLERQVDLQTYALGGGELGRLGISPVQKRMLGGDVSVKIDAGDWTDVVQKLIEQFMTSMHRQGYVFSKGGY